MRGTLAFEELSSAHPLATLLPGLYQDDDLAVRFTSALDAVLAPVLGVLDSRDAYVDPRLAPLDFVHWLAQWVGADLDASWPEHRQRALVANAADLYAWRGTARGLSELIKIITGVAPEIVETGGVTWTGSPPPAGQLPGSAGAAIVVRVRTRKGATIDPVRLDRLVAAAKPAHVAHRVEVLSGGGDGAGSAAGGGQRRPSGSGAAPTPGDGRAAKATKAAKSAKSAKKAAPQAPSAPPSSPPSSPPARPRGTGGTGDGSGLDEPWTDGA
jgi:phage tail-like protein